MSLTDLLNRRRSVRHYDETPIDADIVRCCLQTAQLAPSSSNMQLYEFYHVTDPAVLKRLAAACLSQRAVETAQQAVVFVTRQDLHRRRAQAVSGFERGNIERNSPPEKHAKRIKASEMYYGRMLPFLYSRCFGLFGAFRVALAWCIGLFRPVMRDLSEYDTCPLEGLDSRMVKRILKLPRGAEINMIVVCGIRKPGRGIWGERFRLPFEEVYRRI